MSDYEYKYLKPYKGYDVVKAYELDDDGKHTGTFVYIVQDDEDMIGEEYDTLSNAHKFIESLLE